VYESTPLSPTLTPPILLLPSFLPQVIEEDLLAVLEPAMNNKGQDTPSSRRNRGVSLGVAFGETTSICTVLNLWCCIFASGCVV
jgi:hypothetical protein